MSTDVRAMLRRAAPFAAAAGLAFATTPLPPEADWDQLLVAVALLAVICIAVVCVPWLRPPLAFSVVAPLAYLIVVALMRDAQGGAASGYAPLAMLPVFWTALHGRRWQLVLCVVGVATLFVVPLLGLSAAQYPASEWRRAILWTMISAIVGFTVQAIVARRAQDARERAAERDFTDAVVDTAGALVVVLDRAARVIRLNPAAERAAGLPATEALGRTFWDLGIVADAIGDRMRATFEQVDEVPFPFAYENTWTARDGSQRVLTWSNAALRDEQGLVTHVVGTGIDVTERKRLEQQLRHMADHDSLTGLPNRRRFEQELERHVADVARYGSAGALIVLDVDRFKQVNDTLGHHAGDELIVAVTNILRCSLREADVLARLGGDEFAILLPRADRADAETVAVKLVSAARGLGAPAGSGVTISVGVTLIESRAGLTADAVLVEADRAMYDAKAAGRDRYALFATDTSLVTPAS